MGDVTLAHQELKPLPDFSSAWEKNVPYSFDGLGIVIEYLAGDTRTKMRGSGIMVSGVMPAAYGYILKTTDIHGEEIDVYLADNPVEGADVYVIDQVDPATKLFDEHKVMLGFATMEDALGIYCEVFQDGSGKGRVGAITTFPGHTLQTWFLSEGYSLQPACQYRFDNVVPKMVNGIASLRPSPKAFPKPLDEAGGIIVELPSLKNGPKIAIGVSEEGGVEYTLYLMSAIETDVWSNTVDTFCRILDLASEQDVAVIKIASPGGNVFLMGRMVSAIKRTKAKVVTIAQGRVASAATSVWASGHERHILPGAYFMQHMSSQLLQGKTTDIAAKAQFCVDYISRQMAPVVTAGLFTQQEVDDMIHKSADIYISGHEAIERCGNVSGDAYNAQHGGAQ